MGWNTIIVSEKGILAGEKFVSGDITGNITFANYSDNVNTIPTVSQDEQNHRIQEYIGWTPNNSFNWVVSNLNTTHKLVAAFRLTSIDPLNINAGTFLCLKMWARDIQNTESRKSAYIGSEWCKRVYTDATHYTETYPLGNYWPDNEYNFTPSTEFPGRSAETLVLFLKTGFFTLEKNVVGGMAIGWRSGYASCYSSGLAFRAKYSWFQSASGFGTDSDIPEGEEVSPEYGEAATGKGGYNENATHGSFDDTSDTITLSSKPTLSVGNSGFVHAYVVTEQILQQIGTALFPTIDSSDPSLTGIPEAINYLTMVMFFNKRTDYILDVLILPITVPSGNASHVRVGGSDLVVVESGQQVYCQAPPVTDFYVDVDCGSLTIPEYWANFLDFTGTRFKLFLPAVGYVDLQGEFINGGTINVKYRFNIVDGSFMCYVTSTSGHSKLKNSLVAQYSGVWAMHIPITGQDYTNKISGLISSVGSVAMGGMMGGGGALMGAVSSLANTAMQKPQTTHANGYNASSSFLTHRKPYLIIERQSSQFSEKYPSESGLPCYVSRKLSTVHGYTVIENPVLNIACSDAEYNELVQLLKSGIIL